ncbi:hypothetical protein Ct9H90mP29_21350 [bacterium]|nr:MAG: hypothetical protein Ct9H90mP29_21350 [bacterium]
MLGKFAAVIGPVMVGHITLLTGKSQNGYSFYCGSLYFRWYTTYESRL